MAPALGCPVLQGTRTASKGKRVLGTLQAPALIEIVQVIKGNLEGKEKSERRV